MRIDTKQKLAGLLVPVFALRHHSDFGIGDTRAMREAIDFCASNKIGVLQILPINETGGDNSPYNAISSVALDPLYLELSPVAVPGLSDESVSNLAPSELLRELRSGAVKYDRVRSLKLRLLATAFESFEKEQIDKNSGLASQLLDFEKRNTRWLEPYALFRTIMQQHDGDARWTLWEPHFQSFQSAKEFAQSAGGFQRSCQFWAYVQWVAYTQWRSVKLYADKHCVKLMGDLPFGVSRYSADVWSERSIFDLDWSCGAPPETYFQGDRFVREWGQNWGMPLYNWDANRNENFAWWRQRVKNLNDLFHYFRIDHVLGFFRVYAFPWIPERNSEFADLSKEEASKILNGKLPLFIPRSDDEPEDAEANAREGAEILNVLVEAAGSTGIVAEDLGMVPDYVRPLLHKLGIPGFAIPSFERIEEDRSYKPKERLAPESLVTWGTHDHQPIKAFYDDLVKWWHSQDGHSGWLEVQRLMNFLSLGENDPPTSFTNELHARMLKVLLETPCWLAVLMITDLLGTSQRFNEPGLSGDSNWSQRLERTLASYGAEPEDAEKIRLFKELIEQTHRAPLVSVRD